MLFSIISLLIVIRNAQVACVDAVTGVIATLTAAIDTFHAAFWGRYSSTYSLFWPEELPFWHPRCLASFHSRVSVLDELRATLTYPYPTRFVCVFTSDLATYAVVFTLFAAILISTYVVYSLAWHCLGFGSPIGYYWSTRFTHPFKVATPVHPDIVRPAFNDLTLRPKKVIVNHSHPGQASLRAAVTNAILSLASSIGCVAYFVQRSKADNRKGLEGCETVVWCKDAHRSPEQFAPQSHHMLAFVDTSDYVDMNLVLSEGLPTMLYTVVPSSAAAVRDEYSYTFDDRNRLIYDVKGGAHYEQELWDTGVDMVTACARTRSGLYVNKTVFNVDRKFVDADHQMILFTPAAKYVFPLFNLNPWIDRRLQRLCPVVDGWIRLRILGGEDMSLKVSTARVGGYLAADISVEVDNALAETAGLSKNALQASTTQTLTKLPPVECSVLTSYHREASEEAPATVFHVDESVVRYQHASSYDQDAETLLEPYMQPFGPACFLPQDTRGNKEVAIGVRVQNLASSVTELAPMVEMALREAGDHIIATIGRHTLFPCSEDEVRENQPRPSQQHILDDGALVAELADPEHRVFAFEKAEPAQKVAAPRIISPDEPAHKLLWSRFMIPLHRAFVEKFGVDGEGWYAPGMTPLSISKRVSEICQGDSAVTMADGDKWDSTICPVERAWEASVCYGVFHPSTHAELEKGLKASHFCPVVLGGIVYEQLSGRGSGFADTTIGNTMFNMAKDYVAARTEPSCGGFRTPEEARRRLGIYMGDDSLSKYISTDHLVATGAALGLKLEVEQKKYGEPGVNFISRFYGPFVWTGDASSTCDLPRICSKIHVAPRLAGTLLKPIDKLVQRMYGLNLSDANTPLIGPYASAVMRTYGKPEDVVREFTDYETPVKLVPALSGWFAHYARDNQFPNENVSGWMEAFWQDRCPDLMLDLHQDHLDACVLDPSLFLCPPLFFRPVEINTREDMVTDALSNVAGKAFPLAVDVRLTPEERADFREAVNDAGKAESLKVESTLVPVGTCQQCAKQFLAPLLTESQRKRLEQGLPILCRTCVMMTTGECRDCKKTTKSGDIGYKQRERLELGKPFRCRGCAHVSQEKYAADVAAGRTTPVSKGKSEETAQRRKG
jgi:hypothetical protein